MLTRNRAKSLLDPRTKILLILTITSVVIGGGNSGLLLIVKPVLTAVPLLLFLAEEQWKAAVTYVFIYSAAYLGELFLVPQEITARKSFRSIMKSRDAIICV